MKLTMAAGDFNSLPLDKFTTQMLTDAYKTVTDLNLWQWLKHSSVPGEKGFVFSDSPQVELISKNLKFDQHSGASFGLTLRTMEYIAKYGWDAYAKKIIDTNTCYCYKAKGLTGWCGVAGGGVPACDH